MRFSRWPSQPIKRRSLRIPWVTSLRPTRRSPIFLVAQTHMSPRGSKNSQPGRSWRSVPPPPSNLDGPRSQSPSTAVTTQTLYQAGVVSSGGLPHHKRRQAQQSTGGWRQLPQPPFSKDFQPDRLSRSLLQPSRAPFRGVVLGIVAMPISQISLFVTFGTWENFQTENIQFEVVNFETTYNAFLGRPTLTKFMAIPHHAYLVLKMLGPCGVISIRGDIKRAYDCDKECCEMADRLTTSTELQQLKDSLVQSPRTQSCPSPRPPKCPSSWRTPSASRYCCLRRSLPRLLT
jgi:hypothetical protein